MNILECIEIWTTSLRELLESAGVTVRIERTFDQRPNASCVVNLRRGQREVDLVAWESGEADFSFMSETGAIEQEHFDNLNEPAELAGVLGRALGVIGVVNSG